MMIRKLMKSGLALMLLLLSILPSNLVFADIQTPTPAAWPSVFSPYTTLLDGSAVYDPAGDEHPTNVDITSGIDQGVGLLPSMYVAGDSNNFFVRLRVKGEPYDRKGGFLSSVWLVQLAVNGQHKATIGLNGKSTTTDYVYVANADGSIVNKIYETDGTGTAVPGTRITSAENGHYFIDFQVPITSIISTINDPSMTSASSFRLFFGTSRSANLSVINKEYMDTASNGGTSVDFAGSALPLNETPLAVGIDGGSSKTYSTASNIMTGTSTLAAGTASISINGGTPENVAIANNAWSYALPTAVTGTNGVHKAVVTLSDKGKTVTAKQDIMVTASVDTLFINGGPIAYTSSANPALSGTFSSTVTRNNYKINVYVSETKDVLGTSYAATDSSGTWNLASVALPSPINEKKYYITAEWIENGQNKTPFATAQQTLIYRSDITVSPVTVAINALTAGDAQPIISGTSSGANKVEVRVDGVSTAFAALAGDGQWTVPALEKPLSMGSHTLTAVATNAYDNTAVATTTHTVSAAVITIDNGASLTINDPSPTIRGNTNASNGATVTLQLGGKTYTTNANNGRWKVEVPDAFTDGLYTVTASITGASATQQLTIDSSTTVAVTTPTGTITNLKPSFTGTTEPNNSVSLRVEDSASSVVFIQNLTANGSGNWAYTPSADLALGSYSIIVTAADDFGNEATATGAFTVEAAPSLTVSSAAPVSRTVAYGTDLTAAKTNLPSQVTVTLSDSSTKDVDVTWSAESTPTYNGTLAGNYVFTGTLSNLGAGITNSGSVTASGTITVSQAQLKTGNDILTFVINGTAATVNSTNHTVTIELPAGTDVTNLTPTFTLSEGASAKIGNNSQTSGTTANDFSNPVTYIVTAENEVAQSWTVTVTVAQQGQTAAPMVNPVYVGDTTISGTADSNAAVAVSTLGTAAADASGNWTFTMEEDTPWNLDAGDLLSVTAKAADKTISNAVTTTVRVNIKSFAPIAITVFKGTSAADVQSHLSTSMAATLDDDTSTSAISISWDLSLVNFDSAGSKAVTASLGALPANVYNNRNVFPQATIAVLDNLSLAGSGGGTQTITVTSAQPSASIQLYDKNGQTIGSPLAANASGYAQFTNVAFGTDYYVKQTTTANLTSQPSNKVNVTATPSNKLSIAGSMDGLKTVTIAGATPGAAVKLYDKDGVVVQTAVAAADGTVKFTNVPEAEDYYATETVGGQEAAPSPTADVLPKIQVRFQQTDIWESVTLPVFAVDRLLPSIPIQWSSSNPQVLSVSQNASDNEFEVSVYRQAQDISVILTATLSFEGREVNRTFLLVVKGTNFTSKTTSPADNTVGLNGNSTLTDYTVKRTTLTSTAGSEYVDKLLIGDNANLSGNVLITFDNQSSGTVADEQAVELTSGALKKITGDLTVQTPEGTFSLLQTNIQQLTGDGNDLFFRIVPMRSDAEKTAVIQRTNTAMNDEASKLGSNKLAEVVDIPREIETNYSGVNTWITLPIKNITLTKKQAVDTLRLYIEHTDGTKQVVEPGQNGAVIVDANGNVVTDDNGPAVGLKFMISHFSTFTFFKIADAPTNSGGVTPTPALEVTVDSIIGDLVENEAFTVTGETSASTAVDLYVGDKLITTITSDSKGHWAYSITAGLAAGTYEVRAVVKDAKGNAISSQVMTLAIQAKLGSHTRYIYGFVDGTFGPLKFVTRDQMAAMLSRNLTDNQIPRANEIAYKDTDKSWAKNEIEYARVAGVMKGYDTGNFGPKDHVTRAQMAVIAVRWLDKQCKEDLSYSQYCKAADSDATFTDIQGHWAEEQIKRIGAIGIMIGSSNGTFRPDDKLTREEAVTILNRLFLRGPLEGVSSATFPDVSVNDWAFKEIEEAATDHRYELKGSKEYLRK
ncbi:Ig-like domain-containing protein [Cohnella suwonensis]|uniref:Ig-like domain-containing protein n=1 Tax=Cohnella suwonensis TaxID=696072 RepID=A0ABW0LT37_9BACL